jgi:hypothetical protein
VYSEIRLPNGIIIISVCVHTMHRACSRHAFVFFWSFWWIHCLIDLDAFYVPVQNWNVKAPGLPSLWRIHQESGFRDILYFLELCFYFERKFDKYPIPNGVTPKKAISNRFRNGCVQYTKEEPSNEFSCWAYLLRGLIRSVKCILFKGQDWFYM